MKTNLVNSLVEDESQVGKPENPPLKQNLGYIQGSSILLSAFNLSFDSSRSNTIPFQNDGLIHAARASECSYSRRHATVLRTGKSYICRRVLALSSDIEILRVVYVRFYLFLSNVFLKITFLEHLLFKHISM